MSVFMLETEAASSAASSISSLSSEMANISSTVSGYDTSCEDGFNFAGAKGVIAGNLEACSVKIQNTAKVIETVVSSHTQLQNSMTFQDPTTASDTGTNTDSNGTSTSGTDSGGTTYSGSSNYGGSYYGGYDDGGGYAEPEPTATEEPYIDKTGEVKTKIDSVGYAYADEKNLSEESKKLLLDSQFAYDQNGYAMIGNRYVISCDTSVANVGDVIRFTQKEGNPVECVVGVTTVSEKYKNTVNFLVNPKSSSIVATDVTKNLVANTTKIENIGSLDVVRKQDIIRDALQKAVASPDQTVAVQGTAGVQASSGTVGVQASSGTVGADTGAAVTSDASNSGTTVIDTPATTTNNIEV